MALTPDARHPMASGSARWRSGALVLFALVLGGGLGVYIAGHAFQPARGEEGSQGIAGGVVDIGFSQAMSMHHDQAVGIARIAYGRASPAENSYAESVIGNQLLEMGQMKGWLALWNQPLLPRDDSMAWMSPRGKGDPALWAAYQSMCRSSGMPGLASTDQLQALREASGKPLDVMFLQMMIHHHQGGLPMLRYAVLNAESTPVRALAKTMLLDEIRELAWMNQQLVQAGEQPLPLAPDELRLGRL